MLPYLIGLPLILVATAGCGLGLRALNKSSRLPQMATLPRKLFAFFVFAACAGLVFMLGLWGGLALRGLLAGVHPSVSNGEGGMAQMLVGLLPAAAVIGYLAMAWLYTLVWGNRGDFSAKEDVLIQKKASKGKNAASKAIPYAKIESRFYLLFTAAFLLGALVWLWGAAG